jgi:light-regulated signal transduction histidine kinase (bacteriophytochrome)
VDVSALARDVMEQIRKSDGDRKAEVVVAPGFSAFGDAKLLKLALQNLMENAWKFTAKRPDARIEFGFSSEKKAFFVRDNGAGFDMAFAEKLFHPFERLHGADEYPGSGIGLATVQRILHRHEGNVWAESTVNAGASFYFTLPGEAS